MLQTRMPAWPSCRSAQPQCSLSWSQQNFQNTSISHKASVHQCTSPVGLSTPSLQDAARGTGDASAAEEDLEHIASQAAGLLPTDLMAISADAASSAALQSAGTDLSAILNNQKPAAETKQGIMSHAPAGPLRVTAEHYQAGLDHMRERTAVAIGAPQVRLRLPATGPAHLRSILPLSGAGDCAGQPFSMAQCTALQGISLPAPCSVGRGI